MRLLRARLEAFPARSVINHYVETIETVPADVLRAYQAMIKTMTR